MSAIPSILVPLYLAVAVDLLFGDPPNRFHPVAWMGSFVAFVRRWVERGARKSVKLLAWGGLLIVIGVAITAGLGYAIESGFAYLPQVIGWLGEALILKTTFSIR